MLAKRTSKNQLTLPKEIADAFKDTVYFDVIRKSNEIVLKPMKLVSAETSLEGIREKIRQLGVTPQDIPRAIEWARKRKK